MARDKRHRRPHRNPHRQRHLSAVPDRPAHEPDPEQQELVLELRRGLRSETPVDLLAWVSAMVEVGEPRSPAFPGFDDDDDDPDVPVTLDLLVDSFADAPFAETTAALRAIRAFTRDDALRTRVDEVLARRRHPLPTWLARLDEAHLAGDVLLLTHVLGDGDDYLFGVRFADGAEITVLVYVDHNMNGAVKDAFVIPDTLREVSAHMVEILEPGQRLEPTDAATARAVVEQALAFGASFVPPIESETWPMQRPFVEWAVGLLPPGAEAPDVEPISDEELDAILDDFLASPEGVGLDEPDHRDLAQLALRFDADYTGGDPLRWSPVNVEFFLMEWVPRKVVADAGYLGALPEVLSALVPYAHRVRGVDRSFTSQTLAALADVTPLYLERIEEDREVTPGVQVLLDTLGLDSVEELSQFDPEDLRDMLDAANGMPFSAEAYMHRMLVRAVGSEDALATLDDAPLPDEPFDWSGIPGDVHDAVAQWLDLCDRCADALLDVEHRTVFRRFLARVAVVDPAIFRRRNASPTRGAAALVWAAGRANHSVGWDGSVAVKDLMAWFGLTGSVSQRAESLLRAIGADQEPGPSTDLGDPRLLVGRRRAEIVEGRGRW